MSDIFLVTLATMMRFFTEAKLEGHSRYRRWLSFAYRPLAVLVFSILLFSCNSEKTRDAQEEGSVMSTFSLYKDTLVNLHKLNAALGTEFNSKSLGKPIGISGTSQWLVTVGGWKLNDRYILLQGNSFKEGNQFFPNPIRNTEVEFKGPFGGLIKYDAEHDDYNWLIEPKNEMATLKYQRTGKYHLVVLSENKSTVGFVEIESNTRLSVKSRIEILEWSVNGASDEIVFLTGSKDSVSVETFKIEAFLNQESNG